MQADQIEGVGKMHREVEVGVMMEQAVEEEEEEKVGEGEEEGVEEEVLVHLLSQQEGLLAQVVVGEAGLRVTQNLFFVLL